MIELPTDPSQFQPLPPPLPENPLQLIDDGELGNALLMLRLVCGRNKSVFKERKRQYACLLFRTLDAEQRRRADPNIL